MKNYMIIEALLWILFPVASSCSKDDSTPTPTPKPSTINFAATINGASETPPNASPAYGTAVGTYDTISKVLKVTVTFSGITANNAHIHKGAVGVPGGVIFPFAAPYTSPLSLTTAPLDSTQQADLNANLYYVNIHSAAYPAGEIRGQLIKQ
jgi:hypothetical protein